jgi:hypothetical protein
MLKINFDPDAIQRALSSAETDSALERLQQGLGIAVERAGRLGMTEAAISPDFIGTEVNGFNVSRLDREPGIKALFVYVNQLTGDISTHT